MKNIFCFSLTLFVLNICFSIIACHSPRCKFEEIKTIYINVGIHGSDTTYFHDVLLKDFSRECLDSSTIINIVKKYIDTVKKGKPINGIILYNSDAGFIPGEVPSYPSIDENRLLTIDFNLKESPENFIFYNDKGEVIYCGLKWKKNPNLKDPPCQYPCCP